MNVKEAIKIVGDWISKETHKRKYNKAEIVELSEALISLKRMTEHQTNGWIPFETEYDDDLKMDMLQGEIPDEDEEILVTDGKSVWIDAFMRDGMEWHLDSGEDLIITVIAWQSLPESYKEKT